MKLQLKKPVVFFDLEATGLNILTDRIIEIGYVKVMPNGEEIVRNYLINPECPIPQESTEIHHISDEMVADKPTFKELAKTLANEFKGCDLAGFNSSRFDIPLLVEEMLRAGIDFDIQKARTIDVMNIYHKKERRNLETAVKFYCNKDHSGAHRAEADAVATYEVLKAQLDMYEDLPNDMDLLEEFSRMNRNADLMGNIVYNERQVPCFNFGKYKGRPVEEVFEEDKNYYSWIMNGQFAASTKKLVTQINLSVLKKK